MKRAPRRFLRRASAGTGGGLRAPPGSRATRHTPETISMSIQTIARRAALDAFALGGISPAGEPLSIRAADDAGYMSEQRRKLAREGLAILRARPKESLDVESLAAAIVPRILDLVATREIVP